MSVTNTPAVIGQTFTVSGIARTGTSFVEVGITTQQGVVPASMQRFYTVYDYNWSAVFDVPASGQWFVYVQEYQIEAPEVFLRVSFNKGASFGPKLAQKAGATGEFLTVPSWRRLGLGRDIVFELEWSFAAKTALNGAFIDFAVMKT